MFKLISFLAALSVSVSAQSLVRPNGYVSAKYCGNIDIILPSQLSAPKICEAMKEGDDINKYYLFSYESEGEKFIEVWRVHEQNGFQNLGQHNVRELLMLQEGYLENGFIQPLRQKILMFAQFKISENKDKKPISFFGSFMNGIEASAASMEPVFNIQQRPM
jgi:hypothetical protein